MPNPRQTWYLRGGKARPDLVQESESNPPKAPSATPVAAVVATSVAVATVEKFDFFSDEPLKKKRGGKARPDLATAATASTASPPVAATVDTENGLARRSGGAMHSVAAASVPVAIAADVVAASVPVAAKKMLLGDFDTPLPRKRGGKARAESSQ